MQRGNETECRRLSPHSSENEWDLLAAALNEYGIKHLAPGAPVKGVLPHGEELLNRLATSPIVRLHEAITVLLLTHPDLDAEVRRAIARLEGDARLKTTYRYVAACALQQMWGTRLATDLGPRRPIQPAYLDLLHLPSLDEDFGRATLVALNNREEVRFGYDAWAGYTSLMDLFLNELIDPTWREAGAGLR